MILRKPVVAVLVALFTATPLFAEPGDSPDLYKAYFLEHACRDYGGARKLYQAAARGDSSALTQRSAKAGADRCRDHLAAQNFATLMPPDAMAYIELSRPGEILEKLCAMLGLTTHDMQAILARRPSADAKAPFHIPDQVAISPSVFEYLRGFGGAGVAVTGFDPESEAPPTGVLVIHHGDAALLRGLLETAFQFAPTAEKIAGLPTFGFECPKMGKFSGVLTECLLIVGTGRDLVEGVVARLSGDAPSLASREDLKDVMAQRTGATLFSYVDIQRALKAARSKMGQRDRREFDVANAIADLDSFRWATFSLGIHEGELGVQFALRLADDHHSIAYNLLRLPPMSRRCLECVPANAAGILGLGLNPALVNAAVDTAQRDSGKPLTSPNGEVKGKQSVTGFDIGREFFGNIQELCAFAVPGDANETGEKKTSRHLPSGGVILAVNDPARSKALWSQLLSIPGLIAGAEPIAPQQTKIGETDVTAYAIPSVGKFYLSELDGCVAIATTRSALKACIQARGKKKSILKDDVMGPVIAKMPADSSIMLAAHVGRLAEIGAGQSNVGAAIAVNQAKQACSKMVLWAGVGQSPNQLTLRFSLAGLPNINDILKTYGPAIKIFANMAVQGSGPHDVKVAKKAAPDEEDDGEHEERP